MGIENPEYRLVEKYDKIEIRDYKPIIVAYTNVSLSYDSALSEGFRRIANYIFGGNNKNLKIAMTAPVIATKIDQELELYEVLFVMPHLYNINTLPQPNLNNIKIEKRNFEKVAVINFGGWATKERAKHYIEKLQNYLDAINIETIGHFMIAQYNSPWAIPPFRKNEILVKINYANKKNR